MSATFLPILNYGDVVYQHAPSYLLASLDTVYHVALRFIMDCKFSTYHVLGLLLLFEGKCIGIYYLYKAILFSFLPPYLCCLIQQKPVGNNLLCSQSYYNLHVPPSRTNLGKTALKYAAPSDWNSLQRN